MPTDDITLLQDFAKSGNQDAFATLVSRYINLVYSTALLRTRDPHLAEEITQAVFIILARKAAVLGPKTILPGWLARAARNVAANALTIQRRRQDREQRFMESVQNQPDASETECWSRIEPFLAQAMEQLRPKDHDAVTLRFFARRSFKEVAEALGTTEAGAKMRVNRALEKMRKIFSGRGAVFSGAVIASALFSYSVQAAPVGLTTGITAAAATGAGLTTSTLTLIKTTLRLMAYSTFKTVATGGVIILCLAGAGSVAVRALKAGDAAPKTDPRSASFTFPGYATPEAGFKSIGWLERSGDPNKLLTAYTPEQAERFKKKIAGLASDEVRQRLIEDASHKTTDEITDVDAISDHEVRLAVRTQPYPGHDHIGNDVQVMQKTGQEWKYAGKYGVDIKEE